MDPVLALGPSDHPYLLYAVLLGIAAFIMAAHGLSGTIVNLVNLRKQSKAGDQYVTRAELREVHARVDGLTLSISGEIGKMRGEVVSLLKEAEDRSEKHRSAVMDDLQGINRSLGRIEGLEKVIEQQGDQIRDLQLHSNKPR